MIEFVEPWQSLGDQRRSQIEEELTREVAPSHVLAGKVLRAVAIRGDRDDVLFEVPGLGYAVVHLTWSGKRESSPQWPSTWLFQSLDDWAERCMRPDHDEAS